MHPFQLKKPLPRRGSVEALRIQLVEHLVETRPEVGSRFLSDHELTRLTNLSRPTVRRVLEELSREGWIERRHGSGTFIGPRMAMPHVGTGNNVDGRQVHRASIRLAVMIYLLGDLVHDWYSRAVLAGIDRAAYAAGVAIELVGDQDGDVKQLSRRLMQTRPDVLALIAPPPRRVPLIGECSRLDIHCIGTGSFLASLGIPAVLEDGVQGAALAVRKLVELGHQRIGLVMPPYPVPWVFDRRRGYLQGLAEAGSEPDERMLLWQSPEEEEGGAATLLQYLDRAKPTALLFGSHGGIRSLAPLVREGKISLPRDLSVIHFDQNPQCQHWLGGLRPASVMLPLEAMGQGLAELARSLIEGKPAPENVRLPCTLDLGESLAPPR
jgi:DNA-binding LacI/PurR family transcriptional regulator